MKSNQPIWRLVAQLGDANPIDYGGLFVYEDTTGVYPPECERLDAPEDDGGKWIVHRFILEPCTYVAGVLSDNKFHPESPAWFADSIEDIAKHNGQPEPRAFIDSLTSGTTAERAFCWMAIGEYHGFENLDSYPLTLTREEAEERYRGDLQAAKEINA